MYPLIYPTINIIQEKWKDLKVHISEQIFNEVFKILLI